jgi:hypothetical protein
MVSFFCLGGKCRDEVEVIILKILFLKFILFEGIFRRVVERFRGVVKQTFV